MLSAMTKTLSENLVERDIAGLPLFYQVFPTLPVKFLREFNGCPKTALWQCFFGRVYLSDIGSRLKTCFAAAKGMAAENGEAPRTG